MLEIVFDRLVRMMSTSLRNFTSDNVEVSLDNISSIRFGDYLNSIPLPAMLAVFKAEEWDNYGLLTVDSNLIYSIVDVLLGGRRGTAAMRIEGRPYTTIERMLVERLVEVVLADCQGSFEPLTPVTFRFDRLETNPRFATIARPANAAVLVKLRIDMEDRGGRIELLLPYATLEPIREMLLQQFMGEKFGRDNIWESHLATELWTTQLDVRAVLDEQQVALSPGAGPEGRRHPDAQRHARQPGRAARRRHPADQRPHGPPQPPHRRAGRSAADARRQASRAEDRMSDIGLIMNGLLGVLLIGALVLGWRLERRLKALRASHQSFAEAVEELDRAAARAEQGLADLRAATDEAAETLAGRIDRAGHLAGRLEKLTAEATLAEARLVASPKLPTEPLGERARPFQTRDSAFARFAERYAAKTAPQQPLSALAEAAARNDLILEDEEEAAPARAPSPAPSAARIPADAAARIARLQALARPRPAAAAAPPGRLADDDLFDAPPRRAAGGLR